MASPWERGRWMGGQSGGGSSWRSVAQASVKAGESHLLLAQDFPSRFYSADTICDHLLPCNPANTVPTNLKEVRKSMDASGIKSGSLLLLLRSSWWSE